MTMLKRGPNGSAPNIKRGTAMEYFAGIDVSLEASSVCLVDSAGKIIRETKVTSDPAALIEHFASLDLALKRIGLEAGPMSQWLYEGLTKAGFDVVLLETRHVKAALSAMIIKTDRKDARGIAQLLRMGWYRSVHSKSPGSQDVRALLTGRKLLQAKLRDVELSIRGILRGYGLKVGEVSRGRFEGRILEARRRTSCVGDSHRCYVACPACTLERVHQDAS